MSAKNNKQDIQITKLEVKFGALENKVDKFIDNEFVHFKTIVETKFNWIIGLVILGILIPIMLFIIK